MKPALVIMAAGLGSRYGGLKQIEPIGPSNEIIMDYSIYDAVKSGFGKVVFVIKKENEKDFRECIGSKVEKIIDTEFVFQEVDYLPENILCPKDRIKPWGTAHAVLCCKDVVDTPFAVINADDFYGREAFKSLSEFLTDAEDKDFYDYSMIGFKLYNTLTENGHVARGVCSVDENNNLQGVIERTRIEKFGDVAKFTEDEGDNYYTLDKNTIVSMNTWGFTPSIFNEIEQRFPKFIKNNKDNILKAEFYLPFVVDELIKEDLAKVKVLECSERWHGVTYKEDKPFVIEAIKKLVENKVYPKNLWKEYLS